MKNVSMSLELVPMEDAPGEEAPATPSTPEPSTTTTPAQSAVAAAEAAAAEASLDAIEIPPVGRTFPAAGAAHAVDPFVAQASREYAGGHLDKPLWDRALGQSNGDAAMAAEPYIRARAVALRMADRNRRVALKRAAAAREADDSPMIPERSLWQRYKLAIVATALIVPVAIVGGVYAMSSGDDALVAAPTAKRAARAAAPAAAAPAPPTPAEQAAAKEAQATAALIAKVQELRDVGNYNVMVLYATEWTRKQPTNATAWDELRAGYVYLRQYEDARSAARKAVQLAPDEARLWRNLAAVNMDIDDPEGALAAYEQAAARNSADVESLQSIALLQTRLGRPQESKAAFERAAAADPADVVTACLRTGVSQMQPARDAYTLSRQIRAIDNRCHGRSDTVSAAR